MNSLVPIGAGFPCLHDAVGTYFLYLSSSTNDRQPASPLQARGFQCALLDCPAPIDGRVCFCFRRSMLPGPVSGLKARSNGFKFLTYDPILWSFLKHGYVVSLSLSIDLLMRHRQKWIVVYNTDRVFAEKL